MFKKTTVATLLLCTFFAHAADTETGSPKKTRLYGEKKGQPWVIYCGILHNLERAVPYADGDVYFSTEEKKGDYFNKVFSSAYALRLHTPELLYQFGLLDTKSQVPSYIKNALEEFSEEYQKFALNPTPAPSLSAVYVTLNTPHNSDKKQ